MKKLSKEAIYQKLYSCKLDNLDKTLSTFIKHKKIISKQNPSDSQEFEY